MGLVISVWLEWEVGGCVVSSEWWMGAVVGPKHRGEMVVSVGLA